MARSEKPPTTAEVDALLDDLFVDAHDEEVQLTALEQEISGALQSLVEVYLLGELTSLVAVSRDSNVRRGLVARRRRDDGREHRVSLLDVAKPPQSDRYRYLAACCRWCGVKPLELYQIGAWESARSITNEQSNVTDARANVVAGSRMRIREACVSMPEWL